VEEENVKMKYQQI